MVAIYFSNNELHCLDVAYGLSVLKKIDSALSVWKVNNEIDEFFGGNILADKIFIIFLSYGCYDSLISISNKIKEWNKNAKIIVCNSLATKFSEKILTEINSIDICINGEYEKTLKNLCELIYAEKEYKQCKGISYISEGQYIKNSYEDLVDVEDLDYPERELMKHDTRYFHIYGSRGCEGHCTFCDRNSKYGELKKICFSERSIENIVDEIDILVNKYNCKLISFSDATFGTKERIVHRLEELYYQLKKRDYWVQFSINIRAEFITDEVIKCLKKLARVGLGSVFVGVESFVETDLKMYGKIADSLTMQKSIKLLNQLRLLKDDYFVQVEYGFIAFNPYTTLEDLKCNLLKCRENKIELTPYIISSKLTINAFTALTIKVERDGLLEKELEKYTLEELFSPRYKYKFKNNEVQKVYEIIMLCQRKVNVHNNNGLEFVRNRYYHFYGYDELIKKYDKNYIKLVSIINEFCAHLLDLVIKIYDHKEAKILCSDICNDFLEEYKKIDIQMRRLYQRALIQLKKIDELTYYRSLW